MFSDRLEEELRRCPEGTREALVAFLENGNSSDFETFARGVLVRNIDEDYHDVLLSGSDDLRFVEDLGVDSLSMIEIAINFEDALGIALIDDELKEMRTLGEVKEHLLKRYKEKNSGSGKNTKTP
ncbi:MAG: phosphopantetheine-binding protein [Opitutales bacterium]|nr:phosphopantetheine-binding protein [Opitutales bacterium]